jgi:hypothetical protein
LERVASRRLVGDNRVLLRNMRYEHCPKSSEGMVYAASIHLMLKRLPA